MAESLGVRRWRSASTMDRFLDPRNLKKYVFLKEKQGFLQNHLSRKSRFFNWFWVHFGIIFAHFWHHFSIFFGIDFHLDFLIVFCSKNGAKKVQNGLQNGIKKCQKKWSSPTWFPKGRLRAPRDDSWAVLVPFWTHVGAILDTFWRHFGSIVNISIEFMRDFLYLRFLIHVDWKFTSLFNHLSTSPRTLMFLTSFFDLLMVFWSMLGSIWAQFRVHARLPVFKFPHSRWLKIHIPS